MSAGSRARVRTEAGRPAFDAERLRAEFPVLQQKARGRRLAYLDSAASAQKPRAVIDALSQFYSNDYANIHRGVYELSERATRRYEEARETAARFLGAEHAREIVFVRGTTEAINLVAATFGRSQVGAGDEVLITAMEHHSNIVPWQLLCEERGARLSVAPIDDRGVLLTDELEKRITPRTKLVCLAHVSNAIGTVNDVRRVVEMAHRRGVRVLVDGAQAVPHLPVDVRGLGCDFYAFSGHKVFGPSGIGVLYGRDDVLGSLRPYQGGGEMIETVTFEKSTFKPNPERFEAGTPNIAGAVGLGAALDYLRGVDSEAIAAHERALVERAASELRALPGVRLIGTAPHRAAIVSFAIDGVHAHDAGTILDHEGVAVRAGHHCAQPLMEHFGVAATVRASFAFYNTDEDVTALVRGVRSAIEVLR